MPTKSFVKFQQQRNARAVLDRAKGRLRKHDGRRWPFEPGEFELVRDVVRDRARAVLGDAEFLRITNEIAKTELTTIADVNKASGDTTMRLAVESVEDLATDMIARQRAARKGGNDERH